MDNLARKSGMRGSEPEAKPAAPDLQPGADPGGDGAADLAQHIGKHVHGPDEHGHHHLNLTTLAEHIHGAKGGPAKL